jgi:hypothetical protein
MPNSQTSASDVVTPPLFTIQQRHLLRHQMTRQFRRAPPTSSYRWKNAREADTSTICCHCNAPNFSPAISSFLRLLLHDRLQETLRNEKEAILLFKPTAKSTRKKTREEKQRHTNLAIYRRAIYGMRFMSSPRRGAV